MVKSVHFLDKITEMEEKSPSGYARHISGKVKYFQEGDWMKKAILILFVAAGLLSCGASTNPQLKAKIGGIFSQSGSTRNYGVSGRFMTPMRYAVGQYIVHGVTENDGTRSISKTAIVGRDGSGYVFEFSNLSESQESVAQICMDGMDKARNTGNPEDIDIRWIKVKGDDGKVQKIEGPMIYMMRAMYKNSLRSVNVKIGTYTSGGVVRVPAGSFGGTNVVNAEVVIFGSTYRSKSWYHSSVPINGMVKSVTDDNEQTMELLDFGTRGAVSQLQ